VVMISAMVTQEDEMQMRSPISLHLAGTLGGDVSVGMLNALLDQVEPSYVQPVKAG
jgi:hypothetical protein